MIVNKAYKFELNVTTNKEMVALAKAAGVARFTYNWGLDRRIKQYANNQGIDRFTNALRQHKELNTLKKTHFPWMYEVSKCSPQEALRDLDTAFKNLIKSKNGNGKWKFPKFKKKGSRDSFRLSGTIKVFDKNHIKYPKRVQLPKLGKIKLKEDPIKLIKKIESKRTRILSASISRSTNRWFVSIGVEENIKIPSQKPREVIGVDLGINVLAYLSNGMIFDNVKSLKSNLVKLKRLSKAVTRKPKGSNNRKKAVIELSRLHYRIANKRNDVINKLTTHLAKNYSIIVIEDLNVSGMMKNRNMARSISDAGWGTFRRQLDYKCEWYNSELIVADRFFPSTKKCSGCGNKKKEMPLHIRVYDCRICELKIDRDLNAAYNLEEYEKSHVVASLVET